VTGDAADLTVDPIVNLREARLVEIYLHRTSADRRDHFHTYPGPPARDTAPTRVEERLGGAVAQTRNSS
jgi:hypothetical protein